MNTFKKIRHSQSSINVMYIPALIFFFVFIAYPFIQGIMISFTDWNGYSEARNFIGWKNYARLFADKDMGLVIFNTFLYGILSTVFQNLFGLLYALFVDMKFRLRGVVRTIVYLPVIVSPLIMGYILYYFFQYNGGTMNEVISWFGIEPKNWLNQWSSSVTSIIIVNNFQFIGPAMIIYLTGLQSISSDYYEAADLDGASAFAKFRSITLPLLMPAITINVVYNLIGGLKLFDIIMALTNGGPGYTTSSLSTFMYSVYSGQQDAGYATTVGNFMFVIIGVVGLLVLGNLRKREVEY
ncbi:sugar ABC transporter permease [Paenibacillus marchantiae]|uniref:carbohydrate ABC transporter permease n=1 Tax=Paenibacillus marchantiae TaxID=3026433 RepID=UPI00237AEEE4|nr:sugar ABC transporter permease [Paenibacillus marchantiae]WDQ31121.1 sugar ABC transporter permease [Paenibacillus marchantiae]